MVPADTFKNTIDRDVSLVSTIDHPYPSPPIHLVDGHLRLSQRFGDDVLLLNWDVSQPDDRKYRYDLVTDTGLLAKARELYHYLPAVSYAQQTFDRRPFPILSAAVDVAVRTICRERRLGSPAEETLRRRSAKVIEIAQAASSSERAPWQHTRSLLTAYYNLIGQPRLADFVATHYAPYFESPIMRRWIPWCMRNTKGRLGFDAVMKAGLFQRHPLRPAPSFTIEAGISSGEAAATIEQAHAIPSLDVLLWSFAVGRIRHYGNDRGFLARLAECAHDPGIAALQLTTEKGDCLRFLQLEQDYAVPVDVSASVPTIRVGPRHPAKLTRVTSLSSLLVIAGEDAASAFVTRYQKKGFAQERVTLRW